MLVTLTHLIHMLNVRSYCSGINTEQAGVNGGLILTPNLHLDDRIQFVLTNSNLGL